MFYTVREIAAMLKKNEQTIRVYIKEGKLKGGKWGTNWRISQEQLDEFLKNYRKDE